MTRTERQNLAIEKWKSARCRASIVASTGFGKTRMALSAIERVLSKNPSMEIVIVVPTKVLKDQWEEKIIDLQLEQNVRVLVMMTAAKKAFNCGFLVIDNDICRYKTWLTAGNSLEILLPNYNSDIIMANLINWVR